MKTIIYVLILSFILTGITVQVQAASVGQLVLEKGIFKLRRDKIDQIYRQTGQEIPVNSMDEIQTGPKTRVKIYLRQKNEIIHLYSDSFFNLSTVDDDKSELSLPFGKMRCNVNLTFSKLKKSKRRFRVKTTTAVIGVKGTDFIVHASGFATNVLTLAGILTVASVAQPDISVEVPKNNATKVEKTAPPTPPTEVPEDIQEDIKTGDTEDTWKVDFKETVEAEEPEADAPAEPPSLRPVPPEVIEQVGDAQDVADDVEVLLDAVEKSIIFIIDEQ